jgi:ABC-type Fe3+/spermidine/putrescine transport system ATPase subunit/ABC-type sulfate transport system permease component
MTRLPALFPVLAGLLALYLIAPFVAGVAQLGAADWRGADVGGLIHATETSVVSATLATILTALGGIPLGYVLARVPSRGVAVLGFLVQLPLALPPLSSGILLLFLLGYASPLGRLTNGALTDSFVGIVLAEAFVAAPFLIIAARSAFAAVDPLLEDVAASLGHGPAAIFRRVSLPLAWRTILAGLLLAWLRAFGEFGATVMVAYHPFSLPVYTYVAFGSEGLPAMLPVLLPTLLAAVGIMAASQLALRSPRRPMARPEPELAAGRVSPSAQHAEIAKGRSLSVLAYRKLDGFALHVDWHTSARRLAILGASGSGKSLTLRMIAGLGKTTGSKIAFGDRDLTLLPPQARRVAYVPQTYALPPHLNVASQIRFAANCDLKRAHYWTERLGLNGLEARAPHELSIGQQQRVALARALSYRSADLLLLDEPFSALDTPLRRRLHDDMLDLQRELAMTTILVTHDPAEAMLLADELLLLADGCVLQSGPVRDVFSRPADEAAARLLGAEIIGRGRVTAPDTIDIGRATDIYVAGSALSVGMKVGWAVRPHQLRLNARKGYPAIVLRREPVHDGQRRVVVRLGETELTFMADPNCPAEGVCGVDIDPAAIQVWPLVPKAI